MHQGQLEPVKLGQGRENAKGEESQKASAEKTNTDTGVESAMLPANLRCPDVKCFDSQSDCLSKESVMYTK